MSQNSIAIIGTRKHHLPGMKNDLVIWVKSTDEFRFNGIAQMTMLVTEMSVPNGPLCISDISST